jgi:hypothetical protein
MEGLDKGALGTQAHWREVAPEGRGGSNRQIEGRYWSVGWPALEGKMLLTTFHTLPTGERVISTLTLAADCARPNGLLRRGFFLQCNGGVLAHLWTPSACE